MKPWWLFELLSSFRFLMIKTDNEFYHSKRVYEFLLPSIVALTFSALHWLYPCYFTPNLLSKISENAFQFMIFAVPFHLAALGAFATFEKPILDENLKGAKATIVVWNNKTRNKEEKEINLRQYVSLMFGYLCSVGIIFICSFIVASAIKLNAIPFLSSPIPYRICIFSIIFFLAQYAILSIYAVTFLFDKITGIKELP